MMFINTTWISVGLLLFHFSLAFYACLVIKDSFKLSAKVKTLLMYVSVLIPVIGFLLAIILAGSNKKYNGMVEGATSKTGYYDNADCGDTRSE